MIDSSGRRALRANGTILDLLPVEQAIGVTGVLLVALFTLIRPEASIGLGTAARVVFWILHVGLGLCALWVASRWLASGQRLPHGTLLCVLITGLAGIIIAAPGYMALDYLYSPYLSAQVADEPDAPQSLIKTLAKEIVEISPWFMASWLLINLPVLLPRPETQTSMDDSVSPAPITAEINQADTTTSDANSHQQDLPEHVDSSDEHEKYQQHTETKLAKIENTEANPLTQQRFLATLPGIVGQDVIAVSSDLHYLNVWTLAGRTTVLGNLRDVATELGDIGMPVHRSHWVAYAHVQRIVGTASNGACILSNQLRVPISRRRWKSVREYFGRGVVHKQTE